MEAIILDASILVIFFVFVVKGYKDGIVKSLISFVGAIIAIVFAIYISGLISNFIYSIFVEKALIKQISSSIVSGKTNYNSVFSCVPPFIFNSFEKFGIAPYNIDYIISHNKNSAAEQITKLISPVIINLIKSIFVTIFFFIFMIFVRIIAKQVSSILKIPFLKQIDGVFGGFFGIFKCSIFIMFVMLLFKIFLPTIKEIPKIFETHTINSSVLFKYVYENNPAFKLFKDLGS